MGRDQYFKLNGDGSYLTVLIDLDHNVSEQFDNACEKLLNSNGPELTIDLSKIDYINSNTLGTLVVTNDRAQEQGRRLLLKASPKVATILDLLSLREFIETEIV